jgi:hypothetical protein
MVAITRGYGRRVRRASAASVARMSEAISGSAASIITTRREAPGGMDNNP